MKRAPFRAEPNPGALVAMTAMIAMIAAGGLLGLGSGGCKKKQELTQDELCRQGCEFRMECIEEMALAKSVTDANREHIRRSQEKSHRKFVDYCVKACRAGKARFRAYARCGVDAKNCDAYFKCESAKIKDTPPKK